MQRAFIVIAALTALFLLPRAIQRELTVAQSHESLIEKRVYAYREWQSVGVWVAEGERVHMDAGGEWLYTPGEIHGPQGHSRYSAPSFYPLPGVAGGALIGRIGEEGRVFLVGDGTTVYADGPGLLYLRIDDDILSDNDGFVVVRVAVEGVE
ncbi:MAG: hypothetical protein KJZ86_22215 [Caldilineaceae bacterium]|nr:hypothetical protein [Caldilineaceae bacterium]HRJ44425.1 hypothetical protein [Caldilineaceae bacterium]